MSQWVSKRWLSRGILSELSLCNMSLHLHCAGLHAGVPGLSLDSILF